MNINEAFPSNYLKAGVDIPDDGSTIVYTISDYRVEAVGQGQDAEDKPLLYFEELKKPLILNKTNAQTVAGLYGTETDEWIGRRVGLYVTEVQYQSKMVPGIRIRSRVPSSRPAADRAAAAPSQARPDRTTAAVEDESSIPF